MEKSKAQPQNRMTILLQLGSIVTKAGDNGNSQPNSQPAQPNFI